MSKFIKASLFMLLLSITGTTHAKPPMYKWYLGGDVSYNKLSYKSNLTEPISGTTGSLTYLLVDRDRSFTGVEVFAGYRWQKWALEVGYDILPSINFYANTETLGGLTYANAQLKQDNAILYLDALYHVCLFRDIELKAMIGAGSLMNKFHSEFTYSSILGNGSSSTTTSETNIGLRLGIGLQYNYRPDLTGSLMYRYQKGNSIVRDIQSVVLAVAYQL